MATVEELTVALSVECAAFERGMEAAGRALTSLGLEIVVNDPDFWLLGVGQ